MYRGVNGIRSAVGRLSGPVGRASRYDIVLAVIPATFVVAVLLGTTLSVTATTAVSVAGGVSALAVIDALFLNPPREPSAGPPSA